MDVDTGTFTIKTDQSLENGGDGTAPEPFALLLASLAACAGIYAKSFCDTRDIPTDGMQIVQEVFRNETTGLVEKMVINLHVGDAFPAKYDKAVLKSMNACAVKKQLRTDIVFETAVVRD